MSELHAELETKLGAAYAIERELRGGGMSRVYLAEELRFHRRVVIKVLPPELAAGLSADRFEREIGLAAGLQQANIVPVITAGEVDGLPWYSMPYVDGESLFTRLAKGPVPVGEAMKILADVARALAYAHAHGVVHRDIKPGNVLLSGGTAVVTDFGIAKAVSASRRRAPGGTLTQIGTSLGTPAYMAPEQAAGDPEADFRADIYAWGVMAYELFAGQRPFADRTTPQQLMAAHFSETPPPLKTIGIAGSTVPRPVRELVMRCLEKEPADRPSSAAELLAALDSPVAVAPSDGFSRRTQLGVGVAAAIVCFGVVAFVWRMNRGVSTAEAAAPLMLAVLPFENAGPAERASFADGLTDAVTAKLGALPGVAVIDRRSAAQYRQTTKPARQIGTELGVRYLLEGIVRWAQDGSGAWRAQVTPALVDAKSGTTKWTGEPAVVTPNDPFTAEGTIATKVAEALQLALRPADKAGLTRSPTDNPEAFAAYQRGRAIFDAQGRAGTSVYEVGRAATEFRRAVGLDSSFADAWGELARADYNLASLSPSDHSAEQRMRATLSRALAHAPEQPRVLLTLAFVRTYFDRDTSGTDALMSRAIAAAHSDGSILADASAPLAYRQQYDSAYALARRAAMLDPRSAPPIFTAAVLATAMRRRNDALRYADALIGLDSTDERGWYLRLDVERMHGDTLAMQRDLERMLPRLPHPTNLVFSQMAYAGDVYGARYVALSARDLGIATLADSVITYYDTKADVFLGRRDVARARAYYDSIRVVLTDRKVNGFSQTFLAAELGLAQAVLGQPAAARASLARAMAAARPVAKRPDLTDALNPFLVAAVYAWLHEPETAVHWLEMGLGNPTRGYTAAGLAIRPNLLPLRGTPTFDRMLREHRQ